MTNKKSAKKNNPTATVNEVARGWKSDFIRKCSTDTSANEVVALAKKAGFDVTSNYVYSVRAEMRKKSAKPSIGSGTRAVKPAAATYAAATAAVATVAAVAGSSAVRTVDLLKAVASEIGLGDAIAILQVERGRVLRMLQPDAG